MLFESLFCMLLTYCTSIRGENLHAEKVSRCRPANPDSPTVYDFMVETLDGRNESMSKYKGSVLIIVNVATFCMFTEQYKDFNPILQNHNNATAGSPDPKLYMAAFPCNQFHLQEPGNNDEILNGLRYVRPGHNFVPHPNLHIYGKLDVNGEKAHPMYKFLRESCPPTTKVIAPHEYMFWDVVETDDVTWNFEKFIIDPSGHPVYRLHPRNWEHGSALNKYIDPKSNNIVDANVPLKF